MKSWKNIAIDAYRLVTGVTVRLEDVYSTMIPVARESFCQEVARQTELGLLGVRRCLLTGGSLGRFIYELSKADG